MNEQDNEHLAEVFKSFTRLRSGACFTQADMLQVVDQADEVLHRLLVTHSANMTKAVQVADDQERRIDILLELNRDLIGQMVTQQSPDSLKTYTRFQPH